MKTISAFTRVPIFEVNLYLEVCDSIPKAAKKFDPVMPPLPEGHDPLACVRFHKSRFAIFFSKESLASHRHGIIAHEVFHATHRIMQYVQQGFDVDNHESFALLNEWITNWVYSKLDI